MRAVADVLSPLARVWEWTGAESLHPFWATQRLSRDELQRIHALDRTTHRFNVSLQEKQYIVVTVGSLRGGSVAMTTTVAVPVLTNETALVAGEALFLEVATKAVAPKRKDTTWKVVVNNTAAKAKAKEHASPQPTGQSRPSIAITVEV